MIDNAIAKLASYAVQKGLVDESEYLWAVNTILDVLRRDSFTDPGKVEGEIALAPVLDELLDDAYQRGVLQENSVVYRDLFDTELMGRLTPRPAQVIAKFQALRAWDPKEATDWYYTFSQDTNYIRRDRIAKDMQWRAPTEYGDLDITINLSKPEKDPKAIAAARNLPASEYPRCQLCAENEGYARRVNHPARQNHRIIPITIAGEPWFLQYSPYVYYNEHCICLNRKHVPMKIDRACFEKLLDFIGQFPHYFVGSNADLPIVGGSILTHEHYQGGCYTFAMAKAPCREEVRFADYPDVRAGIVDWPMSVLRLDGKDPARIVELADRILTAWRGYTDEEAGVLAFSDGEPHNTITPIARMRGEEFELDLVLRNNRTSEAFPLGIFHPHQELHHIKKENIGLIEVMGLAVLPARLLGEMDMLASMIMEGKDLRADETIRAHADWAEEFLKKYPAYAPQALAAVTDAAERADLRTGLDRIIEEEIGLVFARVLEHCAVFADSPAGRGQFDRFIQSV